MTERQKREADKEIDRRNREEEEKRKKKKKAASEVDSKMQSGRVNAILKGRKVVKDGDLQKEQDELD